VGVPLTDDKNKVSSDVVAEIEGDETSAGDAGKQEKRRLPPRESLKERLQVAESKAEENYERLLRVTADFENYKKRMEREMNDFRKFANESLVKEILPMIDNLERALKVEYEKDGEAFKGIREGVEMTLKGLRDGLKKFGVVPMEALDKPFDPNFHQAVLQEESDKYPENTVTQELQKGYMLGDRLLRPPMVVVSKRPETKGEAESANHEDASKVKVTVH
jgi:molecular chaperone GrpE